MPFIYIFFCMSHHAQFLLHIIFNVEIACRVYIPGTWYVKAKDVFWWLNLWRNASVLFNQSLQLCEESLAHKQLRFYFGPGPVPGRSGFSADKEGVLEGWLCLHSSPGHRHYSSQWFPYQALQSTRSKSLIYLDCVHYMVTE